MIQLRTFDKITMKLGISLSIFRLIENVINYTSGRDRRIDWKIQFSWLSNYFNEWMIRKGMVYIYQYVYCIESVIKTKFRQRVCTGEIWSPSYNRCFYDKFLVDLSTYLMRLICWRCTHDMFGRVLMHLVFKSKDLAVHLHANNWREEIIHLIR